MADDRPRDWSPLVEDGSDPIPGDWELVQEAAARYRETADAIQRAQTLLRDVTDSEEGWQSEGGDAFREKATELSDDVFQAYGRYDAVADALAEYWPDLKEAQEDSLDLRRQANALQDEIDALNPPPGGRAAAAAHPGPGPGPRAPPRDHRASRSPRPPPPPPASSTTRTRRPSARPTRSGSSSAATA
ncbi:putative T7SS-secreted protein [Streptomyces sp. 6N223]|uniref:putative T7SS-secreted protein n=1 Tax=Streptomyces sp. 6N223 TaxID=3457412 RepID=UPI003FD4A6BE